MRIRRISLVIALLLGCSRAMELGSDLKSANAGGAGGDSDAAVAVCEVASCENRIYACGDCVDNDGDQAVDQSDPECFGPCDDSEESYLVATFGQSDATCKLDCYFDGDNGSGNDDCHWTQRCDPLSVAPSFSPSGDAQCAYDWTASVPGTSFSCEQLQAAQSATCLATCLPRTPPGCDCFGCCQWPAGGDHTVWLGSMVDGLGSCDAASLGDSTRCQPCTRVASCMK